MELPQTYSEGRGKDFICGISFEEPVRGEQSDIQFYPRFVV